MICGTRYTHICTRLSELLTLLIEVYLKTEKTKAKLATVTKGAMIIRLKIESSCSLLSMSDSTL